MNIQTEEGTQHRPDPEGLIRRLFDDTPDHTFCDDLRGLSNELDGTVLNPDQKLCVLAGLARIALSDHAPALRMTAIAQLGKLDHDAGAFITALASCDSRDDQLQKRALRKLAISYPEVAKEVVGSLFEAADTAFSVRCTAVHILRVRDPEVLNDKIAALVAAGHISDDERSELLSAGATAELDFWPEGALGAELRNAITLALNVLGSKADDEQTAKLTSLAKEHPQKATLLCATLSCKDYSTRSLLATNLLARHSPKTLALLQKTADSRSLGDEGFREFPQLSDKIDAIQQVLISPVDLEGASSLWTLKRIFPEAVTNYSDIARLLNRDFAPVDIDNSGSRWIEPSEAPSHVERLAALLQDASVAAACVRNLGFFRIGPQSAAFQSSFLKLNELKLSITPQFLMVNRLPDVLFAEATGPEARSFQMATPRALRRALNDLEHLAREGFVVDEALNASNWIYLPAEEPHSDRLMLMNWRSLRPCREEDEGQRFRDGVTEALIAAALDEE